jgi:tetratricopeptide (TPR) repeat protein
MIKNFTLVLSFFYQVKGVVLKLDELVSRIQADHKIQKKVEEPLSINIFSTSTNAGKSTIEVNGQFVFSQVLIDCLLRLKSTEADKNELINHFKNEYEGNDVELSNLREFQKKYSSDKVLWWYTRESFFYKTLNAALRNQSIHLIFLFRAFISDLYRQLQHYQCKKSQRVYRSQVMSTGELKTLKQSLGQFISLNSFFSTSTNYWKALSFLELSDTSDDLEKILFEIDADPKMVTTKPFADISKHSDFSDEAEVLFMLGSIFRLKSIDRGEDQVWIVRMTLCSDDEHDLKQVLAYMKKQTGSGETNLQTLGKVLLQMGNFDLAEKYFKRLLKELPSNHPLLPSLYEDLGQVASQTGNFNISIEWHKKSLECQKPNQLSTNTNIKESNNSSGKFIVKNLLFLNEWHT